LPEASSWFTFPFSNFYFPAESRLKDCLSAIAVYTQILISKLKAERWGEKDTCMGGIIKKKATLLREAFFQG
jgi:hypothetical protein